MSIRKIIHRFIAMLIAAAFVNFMSGYINIKADLRNVTGDIVSSEIFRKTVIPSDDYRKLYYYSTDDAGLKQLEGVNPERLKGVVYNNLYAALGDSELKKDVSPVLFRYVLPEDVYESCFSVYYNIMNDIRCFPVSYDTAGKVGVSYDNSWGVPRSYGGDRTHEGTDIMADNNERGYFPVVSMTDGRIEKLGWLELGGYRVGIRSSSGAYYYYAHLDSYAEGLEEGMEITAGSVIGMMGDSGYGKEGTKGQFDVHLHLGIYYGDDEISFNPYYILKLIDGFRMEFQKY